ncbi:hypothetical protein ACQ4LE_001579 [Meloidogyne hapla]
MGKAEKLKEIKEDKENESEAKSASLFDIYRLADPIDYQLMTLGLLMALVQAILPPFLWFFMGNFMTYAIRREEFRLNRSAELFRLSDLGLSPNESNIALWGKHQKEIDKRFQDSATPVFYAMLTLSVATFCAAFTQKLVWEISAIRQVFRAKKAYIRKLLHMDIAWLESRHSGQVASVLNDQADCIYQGMADHLPMGFFIICYMAVTISVCFYIHWKVTAFILLAIPLLICTRLVFSRWFCKTMETETQLQAKITNLVHETFSCIRTVIAFGAQRQTIGKYERLSMEHKKITEERLRASSVYNSLAQVLFTELIFTAALCFGVWRSGNENPGRLGALAINMLFLCAQSVSIGFHINGVSTAKQSAKEMQNILREAPMIERDIPVQRSTLLKRLTRRIIPANMAPIEKQQPKEQMTNNIGRGAITFKDVHFSYPSRPDVEVIKGLSFEVAAGEHLAIVGASGSGKSTITALILRFYDPCSGTVLMDGVNLRDMDPDIVRAQIGLVSQEPVLFDGTIADNIRYGLLGASQGDVNDAARRAESWSFISALPDGMRTRVGDRGVQLSGGQKQRVAICRAVIRNPSLMIFDEATSALDTKHEGEVQKAIDAAIRGVSTITIAHRLSTIRKADRIIVLDEGRIVEQGSPEELLSNPNGQFMRMFLDQKLATLVEPNRPPAQDRLTELKSIGGARRDSTLGGKFSIGPADQPGFMDSLMAKRQAWMRSSVGANKKLSIGKSYSVLSMDREKLALPVLSKKRSMLRSKPNVMEVAPEVEEEVKSYTEEGLSLPGKHTNLRAVWRLIRDFKGGHMHLACAIPITILRGALFLLVCFEVASLLEISIVPAEQLSEKVFIIACIYVAIIIVKTMFEAVGRLSVALYGHGFCTHMRLQMFRQLLRHGVAYFDEDRNTPGRLVHKLISDTASLNRILGSKLDMLLPSLVCAFVSITIALFLNWKLALLCGFQFPAFFFVRIVEVRETSKRQRQMAEEEKKAATYTSIFLTNMPTIKAYSLQSHFHRVFCDALRPLKKAMRRQSIVSAFVFACQFSFTYILCAITLHIGEIMMLANEIGPFDYLRVVLLTQFGANYLSLLVASVSDLKKARTAAEGILNVLIEPAADMDNMSDEGFRPKFEGRLRLHRVEFRYPSRPIVPILRNISFEVKSGETLAIVGPSGCGKSTLMALMQRMYSPKRGQVLLDGYNLRQINAQYLHRVIVSVGQEPTLFSFTIRENIAFGLPEDEAGLDRVQEAAKLANIHDFIESLPKGYETEVGEFGGQLSGGQKQRIAIARAIIRKPVLLLLDEATAALDSASERAVQSALDRASQHCTCIQVSHRLSSIRSADRIIVLVEGRIHEQGTHQELMANKGLYYEMNQIDQA